MLKVIKWAFTEAGDSVKTLASLVTLCLCMTLSGLFIWASVALPGWVGAAVFGIIMVGAAIYVYDQYAKSTKGDE